jgi:hypothetical protein
MSYYNTGAKELGVKFKLEYNPEKNPCRDSWFFSFIDLRGDIASKEANLGMCLIRHLDYNTYDIRIIIQESFSVTLYWDRGSVSFSTLALGLLVAESTEKRNDWLLNTFFIGPIFLKLNHLTFEEILDLDRLRGM